MNYNYELTYFTDISNNDTNYRKDIVGVFGLTQIFNEDFFKTLSDNVHYIYLQYKDHPQISKILKKIKIKMPFELTNDILFMYLFRFDLFHLFYKCLKDLNSGENISETNFQLLINSI